MLQVSHNLRTGKLRVAEVPEPAVRPGYVLVANRFSAVSAGTERMSLELARKSLLGKARERPDQVKRVLEKLRTEGFFGTLAAVWDKLDESVGLGYSSAGVVLACGEGVRDFKPGQGVASNGPHAGVVCVPKHLCAAVPEGVPLDRAAYTVLGAVALQGVRLARLGLGDAAFVVGLGLVGQLTVALLKAQGCRVFGVDLDAWKCELARRMGADEAASGLGAKEVAALTRGLGADAVLITAAAKSDEPVELAAEAVRAKGRIVAVGAVGLNLPRRPLYFKEAEVVVSKSYGPGRYDPEYEERGRDYPAAYVRWTEQRNMQAVLDLMASGKLDVGPLTTHRFSIEEGEKAYDLIEGRERYLGIVLEYPEAPAPRPRIELRAPAPSGPPAIGFFGAGNFARGVLLPALGKAGTFRLRLLCSPGGLAAGHAAEKFGFEAVTTREEDVFSDPEIKAVFVATRHDQHARLALEALRAGKHVFVEKPLALTVEELTALEGALQADKLLMVGFNRRFSPAARAVKKFFGGVSDPLTVSVRFNAGALPPDHWAQSDEVGGGRIVGEACHGIDLAACLAGSPPVRVYAESIPGADDQCFIMLRHANGSVSSVAYLAGGDKAFPKERVEVFGGGRVAVIDDFREVVTVAQGREKRDKSWGKDKGHRAEVEAFGEVLSRGGPAPIPWEELRAVSLASILAVRSLREGTPYDV